MNKDIISSISNCGQEDFASRFIPLFTKNQGKIYNFILMMVPNASDADDLMQETATVMWTKFNTYKEGTNFSAWAVRIAHFRVLYFYRRQKNAYVRFTGELLDKVTKQAVVSFKQKDSRIETLNQCMDELKSKDWELVQMRYEQEIVPKMIAKRVGRSVECIYKSMARIHNSLLLCIRKKIALEK